MCTPKEVKNEAYPLPEPDSPMCYTSAFQEEELPTKNYLIEKLVTFNKKYADTLKDRHELEIELNRWLSSKCMLGKIELHNYSFDWVITNPEGFAVKENIDDIEEELGYTFNIVSIEDDCLTLQFVELTDGGTVYA